MVLKLFVLAYFIGSCWPVDGQTPDNANRTFSPSTLPGKGLAQHDFLYAGESHDRKIFIVRQGKIVWSYDDPTGKGEISDAVMLSNGNVLFAHQYGVTEITPEKKIIWNYDVPAGHEVHTAIPIGKERVLFIQNGDPAVIRVVNILTNRTEKEITLAVQPSVPVRTDSSVMHGLRTEAQLWWPIWT